MKDAEAEVKEFIDTFTSIIKDETPIGELPITTDIIFSSNSEQIKLKNKK